MADKIKQKRGTESSWIAVDPILDAGEIGYVTDTNEIVVGDGSSNFSSLTRIEDTSRLTGHIGSTDGHPLVTTSTNGLMSKDDKTKLDGISENATETTATAYTSGYNKFSIDGIEKLMGGEVVEQGSNANGEYIRYENGIMIIRGKRDITIDVNKPWGSIYVKDNIPIDFPINFLNTDYNIVFSKESPNAAIIHYTPNVRTTSQDKIGIARGTVVTNASYHLYFSAIGRWK